MPQNDGFTRIEIQRMKSLLPLILSYMASIPQDQRPNIKVLDIPCGHGVYTIPLKAAGFNVTGCDLFPEYATSRIKELQTKELDDLFPRNLTKTLESKLKTQLFGDLIPQMPELVNIVKGDMEGKLPFDDNHFDFILSIEGIEHIDAQLKLIAEFRRILKPGGKLILTTPNILCLRSRLAYALTGNRTLSSFIDEFTEVQYRSQEDNRIYHGHVHLISYYQLRYALHNTNFRMQRVLPTYYSISSVLLTPVMLPLLLLSAWRGPLRALKKYKSMDAHGLLPKRSKPPYKEILRHILSLNLLLGNIIIIEAEAV